MTEKVVNLHEDRPYTGGRPPKGGEQESYLECFTFLCEPGPEESIYLVTITLPGKMNLSDTERLIHKLIKIGTTYSGKSGRVAVILSSVRSNVDSEQEISEATITIPTEEYNVGSCITACNRVLVEESPISRIEHEDISRKDLEKRFPKIAGYAF